MKLRHFSLVILFVVLVTGLSFITFVSVSVIENTSRQLEEEAVQSVLDKSVTALLYQQRELSKLTRDWAEWDDTYNLITVRSDDNIDYYYNNNLNIRTLENLLIDFVLITDLSGEVIASRFLTPDRNNFLPVPDDLLIIARGTVLSQNLSLEERMERTGIISLSHGFAMLSWHPVVPSDLSAEPVGILIFGRYQDEETRAEFADVIGESYVITESPGGIDLLHEGLLAPVGNTKDKWMVRTGDTVTGYTTISDFANHSPLYIQVVTSVKEIVQQKNTQVLSVILLILISVLFFIISFLYFDRKILSRLESISDQVKKISPDRTDLRHNPVSVRGDDEIAFLADTINQMVADLIGSQRELSESEALNRKLIDNLPEYVLVYGKNKKILYANQKVRSFTGLSLPELEMRSIHDFIADGTDEMFPKPGTIESLESRLFSPDVSLVSPSGERQSGMVSTTEISYQNQVATLLLISDVSALKMTEQALYSANKKLALLSSITRHDILNVITGLMLRLDLLIMDGENEAIASQNSAAIRNIQSGLARIQDLIEFTGLYQSIGTDLPVWISIGTLIAEGEKDLDLDRITVQHNLIEGEIYADRLISRVIFTILENALRHGGDHLTTITISAEVIIDSLQITIADDGSGIPYEEKDAIFLQGYGKNTGFGLYLAREVLSITGISIIEAGEPDRGALFLITIPPGLFRISSEMQAGKGGE
ncbi:MAG: PAS domain S-box protein [Methanospirillaceae archaeon]|nr:PAS domain S-box protein [Methanospirillaceae archaeon]